MTCHYMADNVIHDMTQDETDIVIRTGICDMIHDVMHYVPT